jgi:UDP-GlcNAc:undecaprenyl-phosphate GlcNAc-1-phosphate transferase
VAVTALLAAVTAAVTSLAAVPPCSWLARVTGIMDRPGPLKVQTTAVPYLGGLAVMLALLAAAWTRVLRPEVRPAVILPLALGMCLGIVDDARGLPPAIRLVGELAVGLALAWALPTRLGLAGWPAVVAVVIALVNGVNLLDGLDALAGCVTAASAIGFALTLSGDGRLAAVTCLGAVAGFLVWNRPPARIYLGDGGSYLLGTALAALVIASWSPTTPASVSLASPILVALPLAEIAWAVLRRLRARLPVLAGDRGHSYDHLSSRGWSAATIAVVAFAVQLVLDGVGYGAGQGSIAAVVAVLVLTTALLLSVAAIGGFLRPVPDASGDLDDRVTGHDTR